MGHGSGALLAGRWGPHRTPGRLPPRGGDPRRRPDRGPPPVLRTELVLFLLRHCRAGVAAGWLTLALLLWTDVGRLGTLVGASDLWPLPLLMLLAAFAVTFGSVAMGAGIMGLGKADESPHGRGEPILRPRRRSGRV